MTQSHVLLPELTHQQGVCEGVLVELGFATTEGLRQQLQSFEYDAVLSVYSADYGSQLGNLLHVVELLVAEINSFDSEAVGVPTQRHFYS